MSALTLPWRALRLFLRRHGTSYSAALAYRAIFSFAPLLVVAVGLAGLLVGRATAETRLLSLIAAELGPRISELAGAALDTVYAPGSGAWATAIAGVLALYGAARVVGELRRALDALWREDSGRTARRRGFVGALINQGLGIAFVFAGGLLLGLSLLATTLLAAFAEQAPFGLSLPFGRLTAEGVAIAVTTLLFGLIFRFLPARRMPARIAWTGALLTALLFTAGKFAVGAYVRLAGVGSAYGAAGSLVALLAWVQFTSSIILYGATLTQLWRAEKEEGRGVGSG